MATRTDCTECRGSGVYRGLSTVEKCLACGGSGEAPVSGTPEEFHAETHYVWPNGNGAPEYDLVSAMVSDPFPLAYPRSAFKPLPDSVVEAIDGAQRLLDEQPGRLTFGKMLRALAEREYGMEPRALSATDPEYHEWNPVVIEHYVPHHRYDDRGFCEQCGMSKRDVLMHKQHVCIHRGATVQLNSGGPDMRVVYTTKDEAFCAWDGEDGRERHMFQKACLTVQPPSPRTPASS